MLLACLPALSSFAQDSTFTVTGRVIDVQTKEALSQVNITLKGENVGTTSDDEGNFSIELKPPKGQKSLALEFSYLGYEKAQRNIRIYRDQELTVKLQAKIFEIEEVTISGEPQVFFGSAEFQIHDYEISGDKIILITYRKRLGKSTLVIINKEGNILHQQSIPSRPIYLHKDCMGDIHVITEYNRYFLDPGAKNVLLTRMDAATYDPVNTPCVAASDPYYYFQVLGPNQLEVIYYYIQQEKESFAEIRRLRDDALVRRMQDEKTFLEAMPNKDFIKAMDAKFARLILFQGIYAPLFNVKDSLYLFNHLESELEVYSLTGKLHRRLPIDYHQNKHWRKLILSDTSSQKFYTIAEKQGYSQLLEIDPYRGTLNESYRLPFKYIEKITVQDGYIYFLYRKQNSLETKHLYYQRI